MAVSAGNPVSIDVQVAGASFADAAEERIGVPGGTGFLNDAVGDFRAVVEAEEQAMPFGARRDGDGHGWKRPLPPGDGAVSESTITMKREDIETWAGAGGEHPRSDAQLADQV